MSSLILFRQSRFILNCSLLASSSKNTLLMLVPPLQRGLQLSCHTWGWTASLPLRFWLWFCRPRGHLAILQAMHPLPPPVKLWWPSARFYWLLLSIYWLVGVQVMRSGFLSRAPSKNIWTPSCQIVWHFLIWSSLVCRTCKQCCSTWSLVLLPPWLLLEPLLLPTL